MRLKLLLIVLLSASTLSCAQKPPAPPNVTICSFITVPNTQPYIYCVLPDGSKERFPVKQASERKQKLICLTDEGYADKVNYEKRLQRYIDSRCKK